MEIARTRYLIAGASHAGLAALHAIHLADADGAVTMIGGDEALPYSPTVLPYVVSGKSDPASVFLRDADYFAARRTDYRRGRRLARLDAARKVAELDDGSALGFDKLLLATGARPKIPPIEGLDAVPFHVLRTLDDAVRLRDGLAAAHHAIVLGAGLIGMHAAEHMHRAGARVTLVELQPQVLPGYFDATAAGMIAQAFEAAGVTVRTGARATRVAAASAGLSMTLDTGESLAGDLLLVGTGASPIMDYLQDQAVACDRGILVDERMRTSAADVWAAGDVAQGPNFYDAARVLNGILPDAVEQGRVAGMAMAGDPGGAAYRGAVPLNTYGFFGRHAICVGSNAEPPGTEVVVRTDEAAGRYLKIVLDGDRLHGIFAIDTPIDAGIMWELMRRRVDLGPLRAQFLAEPRDTARILMSKLWR